MIHLSSMAIAHGRRYGRTHEGEQNAGAYLGQSRRSVWPPEAQEETWRERRAEKQPRRYPPPSGRWPWSALPEVERPWTLRIRRHGCSAQPREEGSGNPRWSGRGRYRSPWLLCSAREGSGGTDFSFLTGGEAPSRMELIHVSRAGPRGLGDVDREGCSQTMCNMSSRMRLSWLNLRVLITPCTVYCVVLGSLCLLF